MPDRRLPQYPSVLHEDAAAAIVEFFSRQPGVEAVVLVNSCARGTATPQSDLDMAVLVGGSLPDAERAQLDARWRELYATQQVYRRLRESGRFTGIHLDLVTGRFVPQVWDDGGGP